MTLTAHRPEPIAGVIAAWKTASWALGISVTAPFTCSDSLECVAFLPDFGGPNGMVVGAIGAPAETDRALGRWAKERGLYLSFLNPEVYQTYDASTFKEALVDWGYFGPSETRPSWLASQ
jgi:hypothetical protein